VLIALASEAGKTPEGLCSAADVSEDRLAEALLFWEKSGVIVMRSQLPLIQKDPYADAITPSYTGEDMLRIADSGDMRELIDVCSAILEKTFTPTESEALFYLYDGLRLDFEYIVRLCKYCHDIGKPSIRYMKKVALSLYDGGTVTVGALEAFIEKEERKSDMEYKIRILFGIGERALTPKEREYLTKWVVDWNFPYDVIELAYHQMMGQIAQPKFSYENGILKRWAEAGCHTKEDAEKLLSGDKKQRAKNKEKENTQNIGFDLDEFFAAATLRGDESSEN
jgi:DnaD/phage-associated family protein